MQFGGQTEMRLRLHGVKPGLLWLEAQKGSLLSGACPVIVLPAGHVNLAAEVARLVSQPEEVARHAAQLLWSAAGGRRDHEDRMHIDECCDSFLADLGLVLQQGVHSSSAAADLAHAWECCVDKRQESSAAFCCHSPIKVTVVLAHVLAIHVAYCCLALSTLQAPYHRPRSQLHRRAGLLQDLLRILLVQGAASLIVRGAQDLLAFACDAGAPALASFVLPTASLGCASAEALVAMLEGKEERSRSTLLHRALRSKSTAMVEGLLAWGTHTSYQWQVRYSATVQSFHADHLQCPWCMHCSSWQRAQALLTCVCGSAESVLAGRLLSLQWRSQASHMLVQADAKDCLYTWQPSCRMTAWLKGCFRHAHAVQAPGSLHLRATASRLPTLQPAWVGIA